MSDEDDRRLHVRALLTRANLEIGAALERVDNMEIHELAEIGGLADSARTFSARQTVCGEDRAGNHGSMPEFNSNGSCSPGEIVPDAERAAALVRALRRALQ